MKKNKIVLIIALVLVVCFIFVVAIALICPIDFSIDNKEVTRITVSVDSMPNPDEIDEEGIPDFVDAFSSLYTHIDPSASLSNGGMGTYITFYYADGTKEYYQLFGSYIKSNKTALRFAMENDAYRKIDKALDEWYYHGMSFGEWLTYKRDKLVH